MLLLRQLFITCLLAVLPIAAHAISTASIINTNCSGSLTSSLIEGASFACEGNLTLDGGFITSDSEINISADVDLFIDNINFTAPKVTFSSLLGVLITGSGVVVNTTNSLLPKHRDLLTVKPEFIIPQNPSDVVIQNGGDLSLGETGEYVLQPNNSPPSSGGSIVLGSGSGGLITTGSGSYNPPTVLSSVPEPSTYVMILFGLSLIAFNRKTNR